MGGTFGGLFWGLSMLLHMLVPILLIILAVSLGAGLWDKMRGNREGAGKEPVAILKERYARGEISREEFSRIKEELART